MARSKYTLELIKIIDNNWTHWLYNVYEGKKTPSKKPMFGSNCYMTKQNCRKCARRTLELRLRTRDINIVEIETNGTKEVTA